MLHRLPKDIIMNTADDLGNTGPDFQTGLVWPMDFMHLQAIDSGWYFTGQAIAGNEGLHSINDPCWSIPAEGNADMVRSRGGSQCAQSTGE